MNITSKKKVIISLGVLLAVISFICIMPYLYCYYVIFERFKNPSYITLEFRLPISDGHEKYLRCEIADKGDIKTVTQTLGYTIFKTMRSEDKSAYRKEIGVINFPDIWTKMKGNERNQRICIFEDGAMSWTLPSESFLTHIPQLRDEFIKLRDKYIDKFSEFHYGVGKQRVDSQGR